MPTIPVDDEDIRNPNRRPGDSALTAADRDWAETARARSTAAAEESAARVARMEAFNPPVLGPRPVIPVMGQDLGGGVAERRIAPAEDDPLRNAPPVMNGRWTPDLALPAAPETGFDGELGMGSGGPFEQAPGLTEQDIVSLRDYRKQREEEKASLGVRQTLMGATKTPEQLAEALELARRNGADPLEVEENLPSYRLADSASRIDALRQSVPQLKTWLDDRVNLELAHDDTENLQWWDSVGSMLYNTPGALWAGIVGTGESTVALGQMTVEAGDEMARSPSPALAALFGDAEEARRIARLGQGTVLPRDSNAPLAALSDGMGGVRSGLRDYKLDVMPQGRNDIESGYYSGIVSLATQAPLIAAAVITKNPQIATVGMTATTAGEAYSRVTDENPDMTFAERAGYALRQAGIEFATELGPNAIIVDALLKNTIKDKVVGAVKSRVAEQIGEQAATALQDLDDWLTLNPEGTWEDYVDARGSAGMQTFVATLVATEGQMGAGKAGAAIAKQMDSAAQQKRTEDIARMMDAMAQGAAGSKLLKRMPDKYREAVAAITKDGPVETIRVDSEAFGELAQEKGVSVERLAQAFRIDAAEALTAIEAGHDVVIPAGNYAAMIQTAKKELGFSGETVHQALAPNIRLRADDFTAKEVEAMKKIAADEKAARETTEGDTNFADAADRVREDSRKRLADAGRFNAETTAIQSAVPAELIVTLAERTGQDPEVLWKEYAASVENSLKTEEGELAQGGDRSPIQADDAMVERASQELTEYEFAIWKAAGLEGRSNKDIADDPDIAELRARLPAVERDAMPSLSSVQIIVSRARAKGFPIAEGKRGRGDSMKDEVTRLVKLGLTSKQIHERLGRPADKRDSTNVQVSKIKKELRERGEVLAQEQRGGFTGMNLSQEAVIRLYESANLSTFVHETAHWYLTTLEKMARLENPHPFVIEQLASIRNWAGKHPEFEIYDANGQITEQGVEVHEAFAETFEAYLREGKAPSSAMRSVFAAFKSWLMRVYRNIVDIGGRVRLNPEITAVFDRALATDEAIAAVRKGMDQNAEQMAKAMLDKGVITQKQYERTKARILEAKEKAEADLMARLMEQYERNQKTWWREEERETRRDVASEIDEQPAMRAYSWLAGEGWRDTLEDHVERAAQEQLELAQEQGLFETNATDDTLKLLQMRAVEAGLGPLILLFKTTSGRIIAFPGENGTLHHDMARQMFGLGNLKMQHGMYNPRKWPTIEAMNAAGSAAWYDTTGTEADADTRVLAQRTYSAERHREDVQRALAYFRANPDAVSSPLSQIMEATETPAYAADRARRLFRKGAELGQDDGPAVVYRGSAEDEAGVTENGRLGLGLYSAEDPEIGAEWGGATGKVEAYRVNGRLFDLDETTSQGLENYEKQEDTPAAQKLFARLKAEGYVGVRDPWSGHINVFDAKDMVRAPDLDTELGDTWTNDPELGQTKFDLSTPEQRAMWVNSQTVNEVVPGETADSRQYGFMLDGNIGVVMSVAMDPSGAAMVEWTFLDRLMDKDAPYAKGDEVLGPAEIKALLVRVIAVLEADMTTYQRDAYVFTPASDAHAKIYGRLFRLMGGNTYSALEQDGDVYLVHPEADIDANGEVLPAPQNEGRQIEWDDGRDAEARADAFYEKVRALAGPAGGVQSGRSGQGAEGTGTGSAQGELAQSRQLDAMRPSLVVMHNLTEQNLLHANEIGGLAAPSLAVVDTDKGVLNNFGEISLIAKPDLLSSGGVKTFDSDVYSPRHPRPEYEINEASARKVNGELKEATAGLGELREIDWDGVSRDGPSVLSRNDMVRAAFFKERGELPARLPRKKLPEKDGPQIKTAAKLDALDGDMWTIRESPEIISLATEYYTQQVEMVRATGDTETADYMDEKFFYEEEGKRLLDRAYVQRFITDARLYRKAMNREVDTIELGSMLSKKLRDKKTNQAFEEYVERLAARVITGKVLFRGITYSGNRRYSDYTMENILREMTRELQGGEKWNYGAGSIRARYANQLKSITAIRARKGQLVPEGEMEAAKTEAQDRLTQLLSDLKPYYRYGEGNAFIAMDDMSKALAEGPQGIREAFDFKGEQEPQQQIRDFLDYLVGLPTEYFEAKAQRAVGLNEFTAAIVPRGTSERALEVLRGAGLQIRYYTRNDAADRARAVRGVQDALFQIKTRAGRTSPPPNISPMRLDLRAVEEQYGPEALAALPPKVRAYSAQATDADQFVELARDISQTLKKKPPRSLWKFLSLKRTIGEGNDKISYSGIRDPDGEILAMIGKRNEARGLIATEKDGAKSRSYSYEEAAHAAWEEGYFNGESPPSIAEFLDALRADFDGTARLYRSEDQALVQQIDNANEWANWFDQNEIDINEANDAVLRSVIETKLSSTTENAIGPDEAAPFFKMADGRALLEGIKVGPMRDKLIREETRRRMIAKHGDIFNDGTIAQEAAAYAQNEVQQRQYEIELEALSNAGGKQAAANLARETARETLRDKQVREVLNYNQWLILSERWGKKALEAAEKGDFAKAADFKRYQIINTAMFREARKLAETVEKARKHLLAYGDKSKQTRLLAAGKDYQEQMNGLLDDYQFRPESRKAENKRQARGEWIRAQMASIDPYSAYQDATKTDAEKQVEAAEALERSQMLAGLAEGTEAKNFKSITVDELLSVRDEADMIWRLATLKDRLIKEGERRRLSLAAGDIAAEIEANQPNEKPPEPIETDSPGYKAKRSVLKYFAMHRTLQSWARQFAGDKDNGVFWRYIVRPLNEAFARLSSIRKEMGTEVDKLFSVYTKDEQRRMFRDRQTFDFRQGGGPRITLSKQGRLAFALNWGNAKNRQRLMDSLGLKVSHVQQVLNTLDKRDWDFVQASWDYLDTWFPEANRVHESVHGAPMDKEAPLEIATRFGIYRGGYYPIKFDPMLSSKTGQRKMDADAKTFTGQVGARSQPGFTKSRVKGKVTLPLRLSVLDVITSHLDQVAVSIATEEALFDAGRLIKQPAVEKAIIERHGREAYNTIVNTLVTAKFGLEGASGILAHLRNGATVVGLGWKVSTALLQPLGISNSIVRVGGFWIAKGYARMGKDAATIQSSANWIMERSEFMRNRRQSNSPEMQALRGKLKAGVTDIRIPGVALTKAGIDAVKNSAFAMMANVQFYSVDMPTWFGAYFKAQAAGMNEADAVAEADQAVIDSQGGGELHQTSAMQTGAGTRYAAALRLLTNFMSYMISTYNLSVQRIRTARTAGQIAALGFDLAIMLAVPVAGKMMLDAWTKGGDEDEDELWEKYMREQAAFLLSPFVGISQIAGSARGDDSYGYRGPAGLGIFAEASRAGAAAAEGDFDESFWRPANKTAGMIFHYPASQIDASVRGGLAYFNGETENPAAFLVGPPPAN